MPRVTLTAAERKRGIDLRDVFATIQPIGYVDSTGGKRRFIRAKPKKSQRRLSDERYAKLLDDIKDEIDTLHDIRAKKRRQKAARDLIEYIELHHLQG